MSCVPALWRVGRPPSLLSSGNRHLLWLYTGCWTSYSHTDSSARSCQLWDGGQKKKKKKVNIWGKEKMAECTWQSGDNGEPLSNQLNSVSEKQLLSLASSFWPAPLTQSLRGWWLWVVLSSLMSLFHNYNKKTYTVYIRFKKKYRNRKKSNSNFHISRCLSVISEFHSLKTMKWSRGWTTRCLTMAVNQIQCILC